MALIFLLGGLCSLIPWTISEGKPLSVSLVQGNIPQTIKWSPEHLQLSLNSYTTMTEPLWGKRDIIIWPESAIPLPLQNAESLINELDEKAKNSHTALILGIPIRTPDEQSYYNAIITLGADKMSIPNAILFPLANTLPFQFSANTRFMDIPMSEMTEGHLLQHRLLLARQKSCPPFAVIAFPQLIRSLTNINMLLVVTNVQFGIPMQNPAREMGCHEALETASRPVCQQ